MSRRTLTRAEIIEAGSNYTWTTGPLPHVTEFGASRRRTGIVHRPRDGQSWTDSNGTRLYVTFLCGAISVDSILTDDPEPLGRVCRFCDERITGPLVYRCFPVDERLLYIGSCVRWPAREAMHIKDTPWWPEVVRVDKVPQPDLKTARVVEAAAIRAEAPLYNKQHNVQRFRLVNHQYVPLASAA